jgi:tryptophanyl-tRNA synthetase
LSGSTKADVLAEFGGGQFSTFKPALADLSVAKLSPITAEMKRLVSDPAEIDRILADGAEPRPRHRPFSGGLSAGALTEPVP